MSPDDSIRRDESDDPQSIAGDRFVHGLLEFVHHDSRQVQQARVDRVMDHLEAGGAMPLSRKRHRRLTNVLSIGGLAAVVVVGAIVLLVWPTGQSAHALVQSAIDAARVVAERRYDIAVRLPHHDAPNQIGIIDLEGTNVLIRLRTPEGHELIVGRDDAGAWTIRRDGSIERYAPERAWPRWIKLDEGTFPLDSVDSLLAELRTDYTLNLQDAETQISVLLGCLRITATRRDDSRPAGADRVELWIDPATNLLEQMELHWDRSDPPPERRRRREPPQFIDGPPRFEGGHHPPPPRSVVFRRIEAPQFDDAWFRPETHAEEGRDRGP